MNSNELWKEFKRKNGIASNVNYLASFHFELTEKWANILLDLVLKGIKRATSSSLKSYEIENERIPEAGDYSIIEDWAGNARCVIKTTNVRIIPFKDITYDICKLEGEDDSLESWRKGHIKFFQEDGKELGYEFSEDLDIIFEEFEVVYKVD